MSPQRRLEKVEGPRLCFRNVQPFLACLLLMLCHRLVHTQILPHSALTLTVALLRSRVTIWDSLTQTLTLLLRTVSIFTNLHFGFAKEQLCRVL